MKIHPDEKYQVTTFPVVNCQVNVTSQCLWKAGDRKSMCQLRKESPGPYKNLVENIVVLYGTQAKKVYVPYGKHCTEGTMLQQANPVQDMCNMVEEKEVIQYRNDKASQGVERMIFYRQSHCNLDFIQL